VGDRLYQDALQRQRKVEAVRQQKEEEEAGAFPFRPQVRHPASRSSVTSTVERLYGEAAARTRKLATAQEAMKEEEVASFPFHPTINPDSVNLLDPAQHRPLQDRIGALQRAKNQKLLQLRTAQQENDPDLTFRPAVNSHGRSCRTPASGSGAAEPASERLSREAVAMKRRHVEMQRRHDDELQKQFTFTPAISAGSRKLVEQNPDIRDADFYTRQQMFERKVVRGLCHPVPCRPALCRAHLTVYCIVFTR
jgi:hypothetical protein